MENPISTPSQSGLNFAPYQPSQTEAREPFNLYQTCGFTVTRIEGDQEFTCIITKDILLIPTNIADADDHVSEVERSIRTVKETTRCLIRGLPFKEEIEQKDCLDAYKTVGVMKRRRADSKQARSSVSPKEEQPTRSSYP